MKKITLTRNGQTAPRDVETSTMHADGLVVGQGVMLRIKGDCCYGGSTPYKEYVVTAIKKTDRFDGKCSDVTFTAAATAKEPANRQPPTTNKSTTNKPTADVPAAVPEVVPTDAAPGVALTDDQAASAIRKQYQVVIRAEAATFRERVRLGGMLLQWEQFLGEARGGKGGTAGGGLKGWLE